MKILMMTLFVFLLNLPFGYLRAGHKKFSGWWFLFVHASLAGIIPVRIFSGLGFHLITYPPLVLAFFLGHFLGGRIRRWNRTPDKTKGVRTTIFVLKATALIILVFFLGRAISISYNSIFGPFFLAVLGKSTMTIICLVVAAVGGLAVIYFPSWLRNKDEDGFWSYLPLLTGLILSSVSMVLPPAVGSILAIVGGILIISHLGFVILVFVCIPLLTPA